MSGGHTMEINSGWIVVPGEPVGKARPRTVTVNGFVQTFTPKTTREYEAKVKRCYKSQHGQKFEKSFPLKVYIKAFCKIPKSYTKTKTEQAKTGQLRPIKKPDLDNIIKIILDGLNGVAFEDDCQVDEIHATKKFSEEERVEIKVEEINGKNLHGINRKKNRINTNWLLCTWKQLYSK